MTPMQCNAMMIFIKAVVKSRSCWVDFTDEAFRFLPIHLEQRQKWQSAGSIRCMVYWENIILDGCSYKWGQVWMGWVSEWGLYWSSDFYFCLLFWYKSYVLSRQAPIFINNHIFKFYQIYYTKYNFSLNTSNPTLWWLNNLPLGWKIRSPAGLDGSIRSHISRPIKGFGTKSKY